MLLRYEGSCLVCLELAFHLATFRKHAIFSLLNFISGEKILSILVRSLGKQYKVHERQSGLKGAWKSLFRRQYRIVKAVNEISFGIQPGEIVGFLGPNGAGKTTTIKMLAGLLYPSQGEIQVGGYVPYKQEHDFKRMISLVMGQKSQLIWDIPPMETFLVNKAVYEIKEGDFRKILAELTDLLDLGPLLSKPTRQLSLGERMKCELAASLLHRPQILFLDEPTIGLDVTMQENVRRFIGDYNRQYGTTVLLTSHYMADVTALCHRVMIINQGMLLYDGDLSLLSESLVPYKYIELQLEGVVEAQDFSQWGEVVEKDGSKLKLKVPRQRVAEMSSKILQEWKVTDLTIQDPSMEEVIGLAFKP